MLTPTQLKSKVLEVNEYEWEDLDLKEKKNN